MKFFMCLLLLTSIDGCQQKPKIATTPIKTVYPIHRFDRSVAMPPDTALDTLTGQYCRTWDWHFKNPKLAGSADIQDLPQCVTLLYAYPSEVTVTPTTSEGK